MPYKIMRNEILEDFERYAYIIELLYNYNKLSSVEHDDIKKLELKYKFLR